MCDWDARELLSEWQTRTRLDLARLGASGPIRTDEEGHKAVFELTGPAIQACFTVWSTGMLDLVLGSAAQNQHDAAPITVTEQRFSRPAAEAVLDGWLIRLRHAAASAMADATAVTQSPSSGPASPATPQFRD